MNADRPLDMSPVLSPKGRTAPIRATLTTGAHPWRAPSGCRVSHPPPPPPPPRAPPPPPASPPPPPPSPPVLVSLPPLCADSRGCRPPAPKRRCTKSAPSTSGMPPPSSSTRPLNSSLTGQESILRQAAALELDAPRSGRRLPHISPYLPISPHISCLEAEDVFARPNLQLGGDASVSRTPPHSAAPLYSAALRRTPPHSAVLRSPLSTRDAGSTRRPPQRSPRARSARASSPTCAACAGSWWRRTPRRRRRAGGGGRRRGRCSSARRRGARWPTSSASVRGRSP